MASSRWPNVPSKEQLRKQLPVVKSRLRGAAREVYEIDMRRSWYIIVGMIAAGIIVNLYLPHGWTIWPVVFAAAILTLVHEAAERNGQGVPPFHVYSAVLVTLAAWVIGAFIFSVINPLILLAGLGAIGYQCARAIIRQRERQRLITQRRLEGRCIYCGELINPELSFCENCGEDPDPVGAQLERVAGMVRARNNTAQTRAILTPKPPTASVAAKEQALLARHRARRPRSS